jgi:hypothetical protein
MSSDDSFYHEEHILWLADKFRTFLLKQRYSDIKKEIPESNYQTICLNLERSNAIDGEPCTGADYLKSVEKIPNMMQIGKRKVSSIDFFQGNFAYTNNERFKYVGYNSFLKNQIYSTIAPDSHLYMKSNNPQLYYLEKVKLTGIFEDSLQAAELQCEDIDNECDVMDKRFPIEESLITPLVDIIYQFLNPSVQQSEDKQNNASDDLGDIAAFISTYLKDRYKRRPTNVTDD